MTVSGEFLSARGSNSDLPFYMERARQGRVYFSLMEEVKSLRLVGKWLT